MDLRELRKEPGKSLGRVPKAHARRWVPVPTTSRTRLCDSTLSRSVRSEILEQNWEYPSEPVVLQRGMGSFDCVRLRLTPLKMTAKGLWMKKSCGQFALVSE